MGNPDEKNSDSREADLRNIIDSIADGIVIVDENETVRYANPAAEELLGRKGSELTGSRFGFAVSEAKRSEAQITRAGKDIAVVETHTAPIEWQGRKSWLVSLRDMTKRKEIEKVKDEFISSVSHELRTPLAAIRESVSQVHEEALGPLNEKQKKFLSICLRNTDRLARIVNELLDIAKIEAGKLELKREVIDIVPLAESVVASFEALAGAKSLQLKVQNSVRNLEVYADKDKVAEVLNNLVNNAMKFTAAGSIAIAFKDAGDFFECSVADTGRGIAEDDMNQLFDKFQQVGKAGSSTDKGTGLGLVITKGIVETHGGKIWAQSQPGQGSIFSFSLPKYNQKVALYENISYIIEFLKKDYEEIGLFIIRADNDGPAGEKKSPALFSTMLAALQASLSGGAMADQGEANEIIVLTGLANRPPSAVLRDLQRVIRQTVFASGAEAVFDYSFGQAVYPRDARKVDELFKIAYAGLRPQSQERLLRRILIVDDEPSVAAVLKRLLENLGYLAVSVVNGGAEALTAVKKDRYELLIVDLNMPQMSGYELIGRLKEDAETKDTPVLIMSGYEVNMERLKQYMREKAIFTLTKPFGEAQVRKFVEYML